MGKKLLILSWTAMLNFLTSILQEQMERRQAALLKWETQMVSSPFGPLMERKSRMLCGERFIGRAVKSDLSI